MQESARQPVTPRKLRRARTRGDLPRSPDLAAASVLLAAALALSAVGAELWGELQGLVRSGLGAAPAPGSASAFVSRAADALRSSLLWPLVAVVFVALLVGVAQVGPRFRLAGAAPAFGARRSWVPRVSADDWLSAAWVGAKRLALAGATCAVLAPSVRGVLALPFAELSDALSWLSSGARGAMLRLSLSLAAIGAVDLLVQRLLQRRRLRMSERELREERREAYGDPEVLARRAALRNEARLRLELAELAAAELLVYGAAGCVALARSGDAAPHVVAKGRGKVAHALRAQAERLGLKLAADEALCRKLLALELTERVPRAAFARVANYWAL